MSVPGRDCRLVVPGHGEWPVLEVTHTTEPAPLVTPIMSIHGRGDVELLWHEEGGVLFMDARPRTVVLPPLAAPGPSTLEVILLAGAPELLHLVDHGTFPFRLIGPGPQAWEGVAVAALIECACRQFDIVITTGSQCGRTRMILKVLG